MFCAPTKGLWSLVIQKLQRGPKPKRLAFLYGRRACPAGATGLSPGLNGAKLRVVWDVFALKNLAHALPRSRWNRLQARPGGTDRS